ncbi:MAG: chaperone modulator CbpM [Opitutales bacterium]
MNDESADAEVRFTLHPIEEVAQLTGFSRHTLVVFCRQGFVAPAAHHLPPDGEWTFDDDALRLLRHLAWLHQHHGLDLNGLRQVGPLLAELETLRAEVRFLRRG